MNKFNRFLSFSVLCVFSSYGFAALFYDVSNESLRLQSSGSVTKYRLVGADMPSLKALLHNVPTQASRGVAPILELPMPDGSTRRFSLERNNTMSPDFAKAYPDIMTFDGYDVDNPEDLVKLDITPLGFHAMVMTPTQGTIYMDPMSLKETNYYKVYFKNDVQPMKGMVCKVDNKNQAQPTMSYKPATSAKFATCGLRTYKLALAATAQYSAFFGGTQANARAAMVTLMNRVNGVYQKDLGVNMVLLNVPSLIYTNPNTQPYSSGDAEAMLTQNQTTIDKAAAKSPGFTYNIGHVVDTGAGGIAALGVVCS